MEKIQEWAGSRSKEINLPKRVLNAGSGSHGARKLHPVFTRDIWQEIRLDLDPQAKPDIVSSITDMRSACAPQSFDAIWASHILEHLFPHEVPLALTEFKRILKSDGFVLITSPDLEAVASLILDVGVDDVAYTSPAGPITSLDMLFGHSASIARGQFFMAHKTGFTCSSLGRHFVDAGFPTTFVKRQGFDLWALGLMQDANQTSLQSKLAGAGLQLFER